MLFHAMSISFRSVLCVVFSGLLALLSVLQAPTAGITRNMPTIPNDFTPVLRFAVASDVHNMTERLADMIDVCYSAAESDEVYQGMDAFCFAGDFTETGTSEEMQAVKDVFDEHIDSEKTTLVNIMGNHEFSSDKLTARDRYVEIFGIEPEVHAVVKGFHFIGISNSPGSTFPSSVKKWARQAVREAEADDASRPMFTFQHPHNYATVYGSISWGTMSTNLLWEGHNRVVNFSGHSHFPVTDPRSIWQGSYTALGTGSLKYMEIENELDDGFFPEGYTDVAQFYIVEVDAQNRIAIRCYDLLTHSFIGEEYFIENINKPSTYAYTFRNRKSYDGAPEFEDGAKVTVSKNEGGEYSVSFNQADDRFIVHDYKIVIKDSNGKKVYSGSFISDYYIANPKEAFTRNIGAAELEAGRQYTVRVTAANAYYELSDDISEVFTA